MHNFVFISFVSSSSWEGTELLKVIPTNLQGQMTITGSFMLHLRSNFAIQRNSTNTVVELLHRCIGFILVRLQRSTTIFGFVFIFFCSSYKSILSLVKWPPMFVSLLAANSVQQPYLFSFSSHIISVILAFWFNWWFEHSD